MSPLGARAIALIENEVWDGRVEVRNGANGATLVNTRELRRGAIWAL